MSSHRRGPWSQAEDSYLMSLVQTQGALNWVRIAQLLGSRTPKQCRERFHQNLKPTLCHEPITPEEGLQIERLVHEIGKRWAEIARRLHGRSDNAVKNWWNGSQNRRKRMDRRQATRITAASYDERTDMSAYHHSAMAIPRTLPLPGMGRPLPPALVSVPYHDRSYGVETPLPSPGVYSHDMDRTPSLVSDGGSHYATSPSSYGVCSPIIQLPPLKSQGHVSPRITTSPLDNKLPSLSAITSPIFNKAETCHSLPPLEPRREYLSASTHLPTAPNSPVGFSDLRLAHEPEKHHSSRISVGALLG